MTISVYNNSTIRRRPVQRHRHDGGIVRPEVLAEQPARRADLREPTGRRFCGSRVTTPGCRYTATDPLGSMFSGTFNLRITAQWRRAADPARELR